MSGLSYLEKLLDGFEVEWLPISKIFNLKNGYTPSKSNKKYWENGDIPWFRMDDIRENGRILGVSLQKISSCAVKGGKLFPKNSILISTSATIGEHALITVPHLANQRFTCLSLKSSYVDCFDIKFLFYYCFSLADWCRKNITMSSFASVDMDGFKNFLIPLPSPDNPERSLAIQSEIVRILDAFTALTNELTNELKLRKQQYNYYRKQLLSFKEGEVEWKPLGKVLERTKGTKITAGQMKELHKDGAPIKIFAGGKTIAFVNFDDITEKNINREPSIIVKSRGIIEFEYYEKPFSHKNEMWAYHSNNYAIHIKYIYYFMRVNESYFQKIASKMQMPQIATPDTDKFKVPIPCPDNPEKSLAIQSEIVRILDKFDTLTNSISEGLPREIELRKKQYEHYRNLLFSFPKPVADN